MIFHRHIHRSGGLGSAILAFTVAGLIVYTVQHAWPFLLAAFLIAAIAHAATRREPAPAAIEPPATRAATTRMTDHDRDHVADQLRQAGADGRLEPTELEARLTRAYAAKQRGDAAPLLDDLS